MNETYNTFHGISTPDELKHTWVNLTNRDYDELNILWNPYKFNDYKTLNIVNILYDPDKPDSIGHWCVVVKLNNENVIFFNPINKPFFNDYLLALTSMYNVLFDLTGQQKIGNKSCGFYCLHKLREYINLTPIRKYEILYK